MMKIAACLLVLWASVNAAPGTLSSPKAQVLNGTYTGVRNEIHTQDFFLGIPYAQQPVGDLRFTVPKPLNESWKEEREAKKYSDICVGYGVRSLYTPAFIFWLIQIVGLNLVSHV